VKAIGFLLGLMSSPALATGTATCAGKTYNDISYANIDWGGVFAVVSLWVAPVGDAATAKRATPKYTIVLNSDMSCEMHDIFLHRHFSLEE
jgi:hypothetical protein